MNRAAALFAGALLFLLAHPLPLRGQEVRYIPQWELDLGVHPIVDSLIDRQSELFGEQRPLVIPPLVGRLDDGQDTTFSVSVQAGAQYWIVGLCGEGCYPLHIWVHAPNGEVLEPEFRDLYRELPHIAIAPQEDGLYEVEVRMACPLTTGCEWGVGVWGRGHQRDPDDPAWAMDLPAVSVTRRFTLEEEAWAREGYARASPFLSGWLRTGEERSHEVVLMPGVEYRIAGICDSDCRDLDLSLYGPGGELLESDVGDGALPMLAFPGLPVGRYPLKVSMATCTEDPCEYGVAVLRTGEPSAGSGIVAEIRETGVLERSEELRDGKAFIHRYTLHVSQGQLLTVDLRSDDFDTFLVLVSPSGQRTDNDDYEGSTAHSRLEVVAEEAGEWEILASSFTSFTTGEYEVHITLREGGG